MRRSSALALTLLLAGCATRPEQPQPSVQPPQAAPAPGQASRLLGLSAIGLVEQLGTPALQVREGNSLKVQFRIPQCVLDAYLYPSGTGGPLRVTHVDTRLPSGADTDQAACISALEHSS